MNEKRFDADRHLMEPMTIWQDYIDPQIAKEYPITINKNLASMQCIKNMPLYANVSDKLINTYAKKQDNIQEQHLATTPQGQISSMDEANIDKAAIHPTSALYIVNHSQIPAQVSLAYAQGYNRWLKDFCQFAPNRLLGMAIVSRHAPHNLVSQLEQIIEDGFKFITLRPEMIAGKTLGHQDHQPFWQKCEQHNISITIHGSTNLVGSTVGSDRFSSRFALHACSHPMEIQMAFLSLLESGVFERHPKLKFAFLEAGASWVPHWLWRLDNICYPEAQELVSDNIKMKPSAYFKRQCWVAIEPGEYCLKQTADIIGHDKLLFGSDFPHPDHSHLENDNIKQQLAEFSDQQITDILSNNAKTFFGFDADEQTDQQPHKSNQATVTDEAMVWHPKYNIYIQDDNVLLISETQAFCLQFKDYAFLKALSLQMCNEGVTEAQLVTTTVSPHHGALYIYQAYQLLNQGILVKKAAANSLSYTTQSKDRTSQIVTHNKHQILSLSIACEQLIAQWSEVIIQSLQGSSALSALEPTTFLLVDDFLNVNIPQVLAEQTTTEPSNWCLIKISGEKIWISTLSTPQNPIHIDRLQSQLWQNQPARKVAKIQFPNQSNNLPLITDEKLSTASMSTIRLLLKTQLTSSKHNLGIIDIKSAQTEHHPINPYFDNSQTFAEQIQSPIALQACTVNFNLDGGSRTITPEQTLTKLQDIISPITGIITHIQAIAEQGDKPVKIYESSFFKTPSPQQYHALDNASFIQRSFGKGVEQNQSKASGLGESLERFAALYQGDEPQHLAKQSQLAGEHYNFSQISPFSDKQYAQFALDKDSDQQQYQAAQPYDDSPIHWLPCWSLSHNKTVQVPLSCCFFNLPFNDERFGKWNSNGCAAGNTIEEAIIQGLYEVIERDAIGIWWYNKIERPSYDINNIDKQSLDKLNMSLASTHKYWILDLTTDIGVPVMAAVGQDKTNQNYAFGFGCHLEPKLAAQRALTELCQMIPIEDQNKGAFDPEAIEVGSYLQPQNHLEPAPKSIQASIDISHDINAIVAKLQTLELETLALNYSRPHIPLKTTKVIVPGLCHMWPQLGNERLYQLPVKLGWLDKANTEATLNPQPLYV